eukprot:TRINITY_DN42615_c0_g1_i1.p1 TRINITY_DN42615_c0_g1~~TRINITY_DN42615_c0_g1_i1.p1  ORF type:complete len:194 (-),score=29.58 TRINITY_DN42615_c0_g1_i1:180-761(-)
MKNLKIFLSEHTLIGEYCGNQKYQHLISYSQIKIYFFAIVQKAKNSICLSPQQSFKFFKQYKLETISYESIEQIKSMDELKNQLLILFDRIEGNSLEESQEGSVLYLASENDKEEKMLSMCKLKTLEYRIYRKIREYLKNLIQRLLIICQIFQKKLKLNFLNKRNIRKIQIIVDRNDKKQLTFKATQILYCIS